MTEEIDFEELIKNRVDLSEKDEYMHDLGEFPRYHNESWYFNFIDRPNNVFFITRLSIHMDKNKSQSSIKIEIVINKNYKQILLDSLKGNYLILGENDNVG